MSDEAVHGQAVRGQAVSDDVDRTPFDAIILAGGRGSRLGGIDKAEIRIDGDRLVDRANAAARSVGASRVIIVGPDHAGSPGAIIVREQPPFSGPLAGIAAAMPLVRADWVLILSCDLEHPDLVAKHVTAARRPADEVDGFVLRDDEGFLQWLAGSYSAEMLRTSLERLDGKVQNRPLRALFEGVNLAVIDAPGGMVADIDVPEHLDRAGADYPSARGKTIENGA